MLLTLEEYAKKNNITFGTLRNAMLNGKFTPDIKYKNRWYVEADKPWYTKHRTRLSKGIKEKAVSYSRIYNIWRTMKQRCCNKKHEAYYRYGGRGITVCDEWKDNSAAFIEWAYSHGYKDNLEIDRIDNDKGYCPENCHWITKSENSKKSPKPYTYIKKSS